MEKYRIEADQPSHGNKLCIMMNDEVLARTPGAFSFDRLSAERITAGLRLLDAVGDGANPEKVAGAMTFLQALATGELHEGHIVDPETGALLDGREIQKTASHLCDL